MKTQQLWSKALISLGGNLGNAAETIALAIEQLDLLEEVAVTARSSNYSTQPVGVNAGQSFINAAVTIETSLSPVDLLDQLQLIENHLGRIRSLHWGPRTIDLDLILFGEQIIESKRLTVPHSACFYRRFVLDPSVEIASTWIHPRFQLPLEIVHEQLLSRPLLISVHEDGQLLTDLRSNCSSVIKTIAGSPPEAAIVFDSTGNLTLPPAISLHGIEDRFDFARQIIIAATDSPIRE